MRIFKKNLPIFPNPTLEIGLRGWTRVHLGRILPFAIHVSQCKPESQFPFAKQVSPTCEQNKDSEREMVLF